MPVRVRRGGIFAIYDSAASWADTDAAIATAVEMAAKMEA